MNGQAAKRIRLAVAAVVGPVPADASAAQAQAWALACKRTYKRFKREYRADPYHKQAVRFDPRWGRIPPNSHRELLLEHHGRL